ncbi:MAG: hypothetical protein L6Q97_17560 [Thermoanaerobaculia bacterium]|nr:hypothetical protein [Thermoanaerobaculia bacterium]
MENGDTINPGEFWESFKNDGYPSSAGAMAIPAPGFPNQYYLIHFGLYYDELNSDFVNTPLYYSLIDMNANNGLGRVIKKNQIILEGDLIPHTVVKHGNGRDWWIVTAQYNTPIHYVFLVSPAGIIGPLVQEIGPPFPDPEGGGNSLFTPDGRTYIRHDGWNGPRIYDFDRCTGQLSNLRIVPFVHPFATLQAAVSADSRFFYTSNILEVMQLDLWADDIGASMDTVAMYDGFVAPFPPFETGFKFASLGPDGKIYYATTGSTTALHIIHRPNLPGTACDIEQHGLKLPKFNSGSMPRFPNYRLGEWETSPCDTLNFQQPGNGFQKTYYPYEWAQKDTSYRLMTPIPHTPPSEFKLPKEKEEWHYEAGRVIKQNMSPGRQNFLKIRTKD